MKDLQVCTLKKLIKEMATEKNKMGEIKKENRPSGKLVKVIFILIYVSTFGKIQLINVRRGGRRC